MSTTLATTDGEEMTPFQQSWLVLKERRQKRLPGYEGKMIPDERRPRRRDGRGFMDNGPREMGRFLEASEELLNKPQNRERQVASRRRPARIVRTFDNPHDASAQYSDSVTYALEDEAGERLAEIHAGKDRGISDFAGEVPEPHRRKGYYRELVENLIRHGFPLTSVSRNTMSDPFHKKFIRTLPDDISVDTTPDEYNSHDDEHHYTHKPFFPGKHGPGGDWGDLRGPHRITVPFFDRSTESHRPKAVGIPSAVRPRARPVRHPNRDIVVPTEASREILAREGYDREKFKVLQSLKDASNTYGGGIPPSFRNPSFGFIEDAPERVPNPAYGSQLFSQTRLPGLYESDYEQNWAKTQPLFPQDKASRNARSEPNYIQ